MIFKLIFCIILVGSAAGLCLRSGVDWQRERGKTWGESRMKEYNLYDNGEDKE